MVQQFTILPQSVIFHFGEILTMSKEDTNIALAAITIALCALLISSGQLLGQYFATAEGYRRCQPSVMGLWAKGTRLRWRWRQFRFETLFTVPEILVMTFHIDQNQQRIAAISTNDKIEHISGSSQSCKTTMIVSADREERSTELVCWLAFLRSLHRNEWELQRYGCYSWDSPHDNPGIQRQLMGPVVRFREMSWDFMPPDIVRPLAVTTVSDIAIMVRRLGMSWEVFNPEEGTMRAEGNGHGISSTFVRSIGVILQYIRIAGIATYSPGLLSSFVRELSKPELYVPTREADMLGFGILPGYDRLGIPSFKIGTSNEVFASMDILDSTRKASGKLRDMRKLLVGKWDAHATYGFSDIISLATPMIRRRHSTIIRVPVPAEYCSSLLSHKEGFVVFHHRLKEYLKASKETLFMQAHWVLEQYEHLKLSYSEWETEARTHEQVNDCNLKFLGEVHGLWDATTEYFVQLHETHQLRYYDLMAAHISSAVNYWGDAWGQLKQGKARDHFGLKALEAEGTHMYFDYMPRIVADMKERGFDGPEELVHEAWFTLMFRAFCWWRCHSLYPGEDPSFKGMTIRSRYWDSKLPVYIG